MSIALVKIFIKHRKNWNMTLNVALIYWYQFFGSGQLEVPEPQVSPVGPHYLRYTQSWAVVLNTSLKQRNRLAHSLEGRHTHRPLSKCLYHQLDVCKSAKHL